MAIHTPLGALTGTVSPPKLDGRFVEVNRVGGADDGVSDRPLVFVAYYGLSYPDAKAMAAQAQQLMLAAAHRTVPYQDDTSPAAAALRLAHPRGVLIDSVSTLAPPVELAPDNPELRRKVATYRLILRRPAP